MTTSSFHRRGKGWRRQALDHRDRAHRYEIPVGAVIEGDFDLRPDWPVIYDQGQTNSCVAHAVASVMEYLRRAQGRQAFTPSRLFIYYCARAYENETALDNGTEIRDAIKAVVKIGAPPESDWPFFPHLVTKRPTKVAYANAAKDLVIRYAPVPQEIEHIRSCLRHKIPVVFGSSTFANWATRSVDQTGVVPMPGPNDEPDGGHAMVIVGHQVEQRRFIIANSWSRQWGDQGFGYMPEDYILDTDLTSDLWACFLVT
jgi:C1A family cysteine protease